VKAIAFSRAGGPEVLAVTDVPEPVPGAGELRVRVHAATINPSDALIRSMSDVDESNPKVLGWDFAGVLEQVGPDAVTDIAVGERVIGIKLPWEGSGAYAQRVVVPAESVVRAPAGTHDAAAATLPLNGLTARMVLDLLDLPPETTLAVTGAAGAVGGYVVQLAKVGGLAVIADAAPGDRDLVAALGADVVVERGPGLAQRIREVAPGGVVALVDMAGLNEAVVGAVADGGRIVTGRPFEGEPVRGITWMHGMVAGYARQRGKLDELRRLVEDGSLTLRVAATFVPEEAVDAHRRLERGGNRGRLVFVF
jgi:NADPH:quinone reductase-like Zn-dependent oxidoreductase